MDSKFIDIVNKMLVADNNTYQSFFAGYDFGRGLYSDKKDSPIIVASRDVIVWKVVQDSLQKVAGAQYLYDGENYVIEWHFDYVLCAESEVKSEIFFFHWKGMNALKGFSPLPHGQNHENAIVERIYQWGEPPVFFHIFPQKLIVLNGKDDAFNPNVPHLLMLRGEITYDMHLFEIPCSWDNFRSRATFFIIVPDKKIIYIWFGIGTTVVKNIKMLFAHIKNVHKSLKDFEFVEVFEGEDICLKEKITNSGEYFSVQDNQLSYTPRLFYLFINQDGINFVEILYPLRNPGEKAPFPFVQSHLYSATKPALFILDNNDEIWLWKGQLKPENDEAKFNSRVILAEQLLSSYVQQQKTNKGIEIKVRYTTAGEEPIEFTNLFPLWKK